MNKRIIDQLVRYFEQPEILDTLSFQTLPESFKAFYEDNRDNEIDCAAVLLGAYAKATKSEPYEDDYMDAVPQAVVALGIESVAELADLPLRKVNGKGPLAEIMAEWEKTLRTEK